MQEDTTPIEPQKETKSSTKALSIKKMTKVFVGVLVAAGVLGLATGYTLALKPGSGSAKIVSSVVNQQPKTAQQDDRTFRDFAEGTIQPQPKSKNPNEYVEGTHLLKRDGATPVTLTSSVVDLSQYEGKKVKVFGETQKAVKAGWLMDVGKVEEIQ